jgi:acyl-CoA thioester hydrolase
MLTRIPTLRDLDDLPPLLERTVPAEWEDLNGHVNVRHYLALYDQAGWPLMGWLGVDERHFREERRGFFDLEHHIWYLAEMHVGDTVTVHARFLARSAKRFHGAMFIANRSRQSVASAFEYVSTAADLEARRSVPLAPDIAARLDELIAAHSRLTWPAPLCGSISA